MRDLVKEKDSIQKDDRLFTNPDNIIMVFNNVYIIENLIYS